MEKETEKGQHKVSSHRLYLGVIAVFVGMILIASNFGLIPYHWKHLIFSWEMILIVIGVVMLAKNDGKPTGYILIGVGAFFLIPDLFYFNFDFVKLFWPIVIIFVGIALIFFSKNGKNWIGSTDSFSGRYEDKLKAGYIDELNIFGGSNRIYPNQEFKGGKVTSIFGGSELDLSHATLAEGSNHLEVTFIFGGSTLIVPSDWTVIMDVTTIFGGFKDGRLMLNTPEKSKGELIVKGVALFGGGEIKSFR